jgi:hypothetical protein
MWAKAPKASARHAYCEAKQIVEPYGARMWRFKDSTPLLIPFYDEKKRLVNLQFIADDGHKHGLYGGPQSRCHCWISGPGDDVESVIYVIEGWATGCSVFEATEAAVIVAFNADNLEPVAKWVRERYPHNPITVCADDDWKTPHNPGMRRAKEAARAVNGPVAIPQFGAERDRKDTDFNDMQVKLGLEAVREALAAARSADAVTLESDDEEEDEDPASSKPKQTELVLAGAAEAALFHTADGQTYADIVKDNHRETWPVRSPSFRKWLLHQFYLKQDSLPGREALRAAIETVDARAQFEGEQREVFLRVGGHRGKVYLDLADKDWRAVEIDANGWRVTTNPPVRFRRAPGMKALPAPVMTETKSGISKLRRFVNLPRTDPAKKSIYKDPEFILYVMFIVAAMRDHGPYPGLSVQGEEGTAKTSLIEVARCLIDPTSKKERNPPSSPRDLFIGTRNSYMLNYGNVSRIPDWLSNALCTISTGGSFATRELYSDAEETLFDACRPFALNGIKFAVEPDLGQRLIFLHPPVIPNEERVSEKEFWPKFEAERPVILGALLNILSHSLKMLPEVQADDLLRMADFHLFGIACEGALWREGVFDRAYRGNQRKATVAVVDEDSVANAIRALVTEDEPKWSGTIGLYRRRAPSEV